MNPEADTVIALLDTRLLWHIGILYLVVLYLLVQHIRTILKGPPTWVISNLDEATARATTPGVAVDRDAERERKVRLSPLAQENPFMVPQSLEAFPSEHATPVE